MDTLQQSYMAGWLADHLFLTLMTRGWIKSISRRPRTKHTVQLQHEKNTGKLLLASRETVENLR